MRSGKTPKKPADFSCFTKCNATSIAYGNQKGEIIICDSIQEDATTFPSGSSVNALCALSNGDLASGHRDGIRIWNIQDSALVNAIETKNHVTNKFSNVTALVEETTTGNLIYGLQSGAVNRISLKESTTRLKAFHEEIIDAKTDNAVLALAFAPNTAIIASGHANGNIRCWQTATEQTKSVSYSPLLFKRKIQALAFHPNGRHLVSSCAIDEKESEIEIWDTKVKEKLKSVASRTLPPVISLLTTNSYLATLYAHTKEAGSAAKQMRVWNINDLKQPLLTYSDQSTITTLSEESIKSTIHKFSLLKKKKAEQPKQTGHSNKDIWTELTRF